MGYDVEYSGDASYDVELKTVAEVFSTTIKVDSSFNPEYMLESDYEADFGVVTEVPIGTEPYTGSYEFEPTTAVQTVPTYGKSMLGNIKIKPIPSNYGLITYNGNITVS